MNCEYMKRIVFTLILFCYSILNTFAQTGIYEDLAAGFNGSDQRLISKYFNNKVELTIMDQSNVYSKTQAELVLRDFFVKYPPIEFQILHRNNKSGTEGAGFAIGQMNTRSGNFRVYFIIKQVDNTTYLQEMRFEAERR